MHVSRSCIFKYITRIYLLKQQKTAPNMQVGAVLHLAHYVITHFILLYLTSGLSRIVQVY